MKIFAAICVIFGGAYAGITFFTERKRLEKMVSQFEEALCYMQAELNFRKTPLDEIFLSLSLHMENPLKKLFFVLGKEISKNPQKSLEEQMCFAISSVKTLPKEIISILKSLSRLLGEQGLQEQINGIALVQERLKMLYLHCQNENRTKGKSYCMIGICTGIALAIVLI